MTIKTTILKKKPKDISIEPTATFIETQQVASKKQQAVSKEQQIELIEPTAIFIETQQAASKEPQTEPIEPTTISTKTQQTASKTQDASKEPQTEPIELTATSTEIQQAVPLKGEFIKFEVPGDGNCLLHAGALNFLLLNYLELENRFYKLFGENLEDHSTVEKFLMNFDFTDLKGKIDQNEELRKDWAKLIQKLRERLISFIRDPKNNFKEELATKEKFLSQESIESEYQNISNEEFLKEGKELEANHIMGLAKLLDHSIILCNGREEIQPPSRFIYNNGKDPLILKNNLIKKHYEFQLSKEVIDLNKKLREKKVVDLNQKLKENEKALENILKNIETLPKLNTDKIDEREETNTSLYPEVTILLDKQEKLVKELKKINETNFSTSKNINANTSVLEPSKANKTTHTLMDQDDDLVNFNMIKNTSNILKPNNTNSLINLSRTEVLTKSNSVYQSDSFKKAKTETEIYNLEKKTQGFKEQNKNKSQSLRNIIIKQIKSLGKGRRNGNKIPYKRFY